MTGMCLLTSHVIPNIIENTGPGSVMEPPKVTQMDAWAHLIWTVNSVAVNISLNWENRRVRAKMKKVLKFELLNNCISCDLYLLFTRCYATVCLQFSCLNIKTINQTSIFHLRSCPIWFYYSNWSNVAQPDSPRDMYWSLQRNLMNCGILMTSMRPVWLTSKCPQALAK